MAYEGYLALGGYELCNDARAQAGADLAGLNTTIVPADHDTGLLFQNVTYTGEPEAGAPWYSAAVPRSTGVVGMFGIDLTGLDASTSTRTITDGIGDGGLPGVLRAAHREIGVTVGVLATSAAAAEYGVNWLDGALAAGSDNVLADYPVPAALDAFAHPPVAGAPAPGLRHLYDVTVLAAPTVTARTALPYCTDTGAPATAWLYTVQFTLGAGWPWLYGTPAVLATGRPLAPWPGGQPVVWHPCRGAGCPPPHGTGCYPTTRTVLLGDPLAPATATVALPAATLHPTQATTTMVPAQVVVAVGAADHPLPASVPLIEVSTGTAAMRRLTVTWASAAPDLEPCAAYRGELCVPYLPANVTLRLDGRRQRATVTNTAGVSVPCPVLGLRGGPPRWPVFTEPAQTLTVAAEDQYHSAAARVKVSVATRQDLT